MGTDGRAWFKLYPSDFLAGDPALLSNEEFGVLMRLLFHNWIAESLPNEVEQLARLCGADPEKFEAVWKAVQSNFAAIEPDKTRITNPGLAAYEQRRALISAKKAASGRASGRARGDGSKRSTDVPPTVEHSVEHPSSRVEKSRGEESGVEDPLKPPSLGGPEKPVRTKPKQPTQEPQNGTSKRKRTKGTPTPLPPDFEPSRLSIEWFRGKYGGFPEREVDHQTERFKINAAQHGKIFVDWQAAWKTWMSNWQTNFGKNLPEPRPAGGKQPWEANGNKNLLSPDG